LPAGTAEPSAAAASWQQVPGAPQRLVPPRWLPATGLAALEIEWPGAGGEYRAQILGNFEGPYAAPPWVGKVPAAAHGGVARLWLDTTAVLPWLVATTLGAGVAGIELWIDGQPPPAGTVVRAHARLGTTLPVVQPTATIPRAELSQWLEPPAGADELHLLLPTGCYAMAVERSRAVGGAVELAAGLRQQLDFVCDVLGPCRVHWFFAGQAGPGEPPQRSRLGTAIVR
jgi:hypothetical protein